MGKEKVLVIGASGFLGKALMWELPKKFEVVGTYNNNPVQGMVRMDLNNYLELKKALEKIFPEIVVLAAAEANVDAYESSAFISRKQVSSAETIVGWCKENKKKIVFISTDFVFDGMKGNYSEDDKPKPINAYGKNKLDIEKIAESAPNNLILRVSTLYGIPVLPEKFIGKTIKKLSGNEFVEAAADWRRNPTLTSDVAVALSLLLEKNQNGLFHVAGLSQLSMYEMALAIAREFSADETLVKKGTGGRLVLPAKRPLNTTLDISKISGFGVKMSSFPDGIRFVHENM